MPIVKLTPGALLDIRSKILEDFPHQGESCEIFYTPVTAALELEAIKAFRKGQGDDKTDDQRDESLTIQMDIGARVISEHLVTALDDPTPLFTLDQARRLSIFYTKTLTNAMSARDREMGEDSEPTDGTGNSSGGSVEEQTGSESGM